jgi:hypothetical protein
MKKRAVLLATLIACAATAFVWAETDEEVEAHKQVLDLTGAFTNEGFKLRDGHWAGPIKPKERAVIAVNLYAGNQYWFSLGATAAAKKVAVSLYDENGKPLGFEPYSEEGRAAAGFAPRVSGTYYVKVEELEGAPSSFCLLYSYK